MRHLKGKTGTYMIKNILNNRIYIGSSSTCLYARLSCHFNSLKDNRHHSRFLQRDYNKHGNNFIYGVLEFCSPDDCLKIEQKYLDSYKPNYNHCPIAGSTRGLKQSSTARINNGLAKKGQVPWNKGKKIGNNYKKDSFKKRQKTLAKNKNIAGKKPIRITLSGKDEHISFLKMQYCADFIGVDISYISVKLKNNNKVKIKNYTLEKI